MRPRINPYHYRVINARFAMAELKSTLPDSLVTDIPRKVMDRFIRITQPVSGITPVTSLAHLETLKAAAIERFNESLKDGEGWPGDDIELLSTTNYLHHTLAWSGQKGGIDWQGFADFIDELPLPERRQVSTLFSVMTGRSPEDLLRPAQKSWAVPTRIDELKDAREIAGRLFVETDSGKWLRADRYVQHFEVLMEFERVDFDEEEDSERTYKVENLIGSAGSLAGAFDIAEQIVSDIGIIHDSSGTRIDKGQMLPLSIRIMPREPHYQSNSQPIITAKVSSQIRRMDGETFETGQIQWQEPLNQEQIEAAELKLQDLRNDHAENSRADNYNTCSNISDQMRRIQARFPHKDYDQVTVMTSLREALATIGSDRSLTNLLETELGL